jgi:hypothetical protein
MLLIAAEMVGVQDELLEMVRMMKRSQMGPGVPFIDRMRGSRGFHF